MNPERFKKCLEDSYENVQLVYGKMDMITSELKEHGFEVFVVPNVKSENGMYWSCYSGDFIVEHYDSEYWQKKYISP